MAMLDLGRVHRSNTEGRLLKATAIIVSFSVPPNRCNIVLKI